MADSLPFNAVKIDGEFDRTYKAEDWAWYFSTFLASGVFPKPSDGLQVIATYSGMEIRVNKGYAFINGYAFRNPASKSVMLGRAEGALNRIDRVVVRWDMVLRDIYIDVLKGVPSARPVAAAVTRNTEIWELALADIYVGKGVTGIRTQDITDQRFNSAVCGIVAGTVKEIDASVLTRQFNDFFDSYSQRILLDYEEYRRKISDYEARAEDAKEDLRQSLDTFGQNALSDYESYLHVITGNQERAETEYEEFMARAREYLDGLKESGEDGLVAVLESMREYRGEAERQFDEWFDNLAVQLSGDVAGNLQNEINSIRATLREITENEIDEIIGGTYESQEGGMEPDIYSKVTEAEVESIVNQAFGGDDL